MNIRDYLQNIARQPMTAGARRAAVAKEEANLEEMRQSLSRDEYEEIRAIIQDMREGFARHGAFRARLEEAPRWGDKQERFTVMIKAACPGESLREAACAAARSLAEGSTVLVEDKFSGEKQHIRVEPIRHTAAAGRESWKKLESGDRTSPEETRAMMEQIEAALPYLQARCPEYALAYRDAIHTRERLRLRMDG